MNLIPLRTAAIAGTAVLALSFVAVPALADTGGSGGPGSSTSAMPAATGDGTSTDDPGDDVSDDSGDDGSSVDGTTDDGSVDDGTIDDGTVDDGSADDGSGADATDDSGAADSGSPRPAEEGTPAEHLASAVVTPSVFAKKGIRLSFTGLTPGAQYQPVWSAIGVGEPIGAAKTADAAGRLSVRWKPGRSRTFLGSYNVGLVGNETDLYLVKVLEIKYDSDLIWVPAQRAGKKVVLSVIADRAGASGVADSPWKSVVVQFQKKSGRSWVTVKRVRTNAAGVATARVGSGVQVWRAVVESSATVAGSVTGGHRR